MSELQNPVSGAGDVQLQYQKLYNNQLRGSNSLEECIQLQECIHMGVEELLSPAIPNYCNKKEGTAVLASVALEGRTSSEGTPEHKHSHTTIYWAIRACGTG